MESGERADQQRWAAMDEVQLRGEMGRIKPPSAREVAARQPAVVAARTTEQGALARAEEARKEGQAWATVAREKQGEWMRLSARRSPFDRLTRLLHEKGIVENRTLGAAEANLAEARARHEAARQAEVLARAEAHLAAERARTVVEAVLPEIEAQLQPARERYGMMAKVLSQKRDEAERAHEKEPRTSSMRHEARGRGLER